MAQVVADLVRVQADAGRQVTVACPPGQLQEMARAAGADVVTWSAARGPGVRTPGELAALSRVIRRVRPSVVHLHSSQAGMVGRLVVRGRIPTVFSPHAWSWQPMSGAGRRAAVAWERRAARWTQAIVCVSDGERRDGLEQRIPGSLLVIRNGVEADLDAQIGHDSQPEARRALGRGESTQLVVCCARLAEQKGQDDLLTTWPRVTEELPGSELVLVGDGPLRSELERAADGLAGGDLRRMAVPRGLPAMDAGGVGRRVPLALRGDVVGAPGGRRTGHAGGRDPRGGNGVRRCRPTPGGWSSPATRARWPMRWSTFSGTARRWIEAAARPRHGHATEPRRRAPDGSTSRCTTVFVPRPGDHETHASDRRPPSVPRWRLSLPGVRGIDGWQRLFDGRCGGGGR